MEYFEKELGECFPKNIRETSSREFTLKQRMWLYMS